MKIQFMKFLILAMGILGAGVITAQKVITFEGGQVEVVFKANTKGNEALVPLSGNSLNMDFSGVEKPQFQVQFQNLKWNAGYEGSTLALKSAFANQPKGMSKTTKRDQKMSKSSHKRRISYTVNGDGTGQIKIGFGVVKEGVDPSTATQAASVTSSVYITGFKKAVAAPTTPAWPTGWQGSDYYFKDGKVKVRILTNATGKKIFDKNDNPLINFKGVSKPIIQLELSSTGWKDSPKKLAIKNGWVRGTAGALKKSTTANVELKGGETKTISFVPTGNGAASITFQFGVGEASASIGSIASSGSVTKSFRIAGIGPDEEEEKDKEKLKKEEDEAYKTAIQSNTFKAYQDYLSDPRFSKTNDFDKHGRDILAKIKQTAISYKTISKTEDSEGNFIFEIELSDVKDPSASSTDENVEATVVENALKVIIKDGDVHKVTITDAYERTIDIELNPESKVLAGEFKDGEETISYTIKGGEPPYYVTIIDAATERFIGSLPKISPAEGKSSVKGEFIKQELADEFGLEGSYKLQLKDSPKLEKIISEGEIVFAPSGMQGVIWVLLGVMVVLLIVIGFVIKKNL